MIGGLLLLVYRNHVDEFIGIVFGLLLLVYRNHVDEFIGICFSSFECFEKSDLYGIFEVGLLINGCIFAIELVFVYERPTSTLRCWTKIRPELSQLVDLNLALNVLTGKISSGFSRMTSLNMLNLSRNELTGSIPTDFDKLRLSLVDLSYNHLSGRVLPYFLNVAGDKALFGNQDLSMDENESARRLVNSELGFCGGNNGNKGFFKSKVVIFCTILLALVVLLLGLMLVCYRNLEWAGPGSNPEDEKDNSPNSKGV
ncbi:leucine-rich receptor-like protein kinase family protein [Striga asiatica]|uniref:Leucine-rich receptor-like protein kinase family protein n=1 Tax=Striga asiatica TaxID=4170 RepID=A0A5A7P3X5_STRAF|nr:leucine-rich receptor-like protein kinase family protein [Striga asiatica]